MDIHDGYTMDIRWIFTCEAPETDEAGGLLSLGEYFSLRRIYSYTYIGMHIPIYCRIHSYLYGAFLQQYTGML